MTIYKFVKLGPPYLFQYLMFILSHLNIPISLLFVGILIAIVSGSIWHLYPLCPNIRVRIISIQLPSRRAIQRPSVNHFQHLQTRDSLIMISFQLQCPLPKIAFQTISIQINCQHIFQIFNKRNQANLSLMFHKVGKIDHKIYVLIYLI